jgi:leucyl-tRNA synthetase
LEGLGEATKPGYVTADPLTYIYIKDFRNELKKNPTMAESIIWEYLKTKKTGHKIRRQHIIGGYITDFVCLRKKLILEIDGEVHLNQKDYDENRTRILNELGYDLIRFTNKEVIENSIKIAQKIKTILDLKVFN